MWQAKRNTAIGLPRYALRAVAMTLLLATSVGQTSGAETDPKQLIDRLIATSWTTRSVTPSAPCGDGELVRRVHLDLIGRIPTSAEVRAFLKDTRPDKRAKLVDSLLAGKEHAQHMREVFDVVLMGRKKNGRDSAWLNYLERSFASNRPWDAMVGDMLLARATGEADRGASWFLYARRGKHQDMAEAVSPAFFGVEIRCAQCHDHPLADEIEQRHYWGLVAFFRRSSNVKTKQGPGVAESAVGGFSQFTDLSGASHDALLTFLGGKTVEETRPAKGSKDADSSKRYVVPPAAKGKTPSSPAVPKVSRRRQFVDTFVTNNPVIARAAVNRIWALLMGRGIVHPVSRMDSTSEPSHPELLKQLAEDFAASGYDIRRLVRAIVLSRPYQLASRPTGSRATDDTFSFALDKPLTAEVLYRSMRLAAGAAPAGDEDPLLADFRRVFPDVLPEHHFANLRQAMFLTNNPAVQQLVAAKKDSTAGRLAAIKEHPKRVREAFLIAFARLPDKEELRRATAYLAARKDRPEKAAAQLLWALLTSAEFRMNH